MDRWVGHLVPKTQHEVEGMEPYEVQEFCRKFVRDYAVGGTLRRRLLGAAFDNGLREDEVRDVIAIRLRDHFLAQRCSAAEPPSLASPQCKRCFTECKPWLTVPRVSEAES